MTTKRTAKRKLSNFDFSKEGSHIALVHKDQGGAANGYSTLITKATEKYSPEFIQKMQLIRVTMELDDFLEKFFGLWESDAKVLAAMMGYKEEPEGEGEPANTYNDDSFYEWYDDKLKESGGRWVEPTDSDYREWIAARLSGFEIVKGAYEADSQVDFLASLNEEDYLSLLKDQERLEKALSNEGKDGLLDSLTGGKKPIDKGVDTSKKISKKASKAVNTEETIMSGTNPEMIEKSQYEEILKQQKETQEQLQKAMEALAVVEKEKKEQIAKSRKAELVGAVGEADAEQLFKAVGELEDEKFNAVVAVIKALNEKVDSSDLFIEKGANGEGTEQVAKSALATKLKQKYETK